MSDFRRPWWLIVNKPAGLTSTVREESGPGRRIFIIRGEPLVQGLVWLTWGPAAALIAVVLVVGIALAINVKTQPTAIRGLVIAAFLGLPALAWGATALALARLSAKYLQAEREAATQECVIHLNQTQGELTYRTAAKPERKLAYHDIHRARVTHPVGSQNSQAVQLTLETTAGPIILLDEMLGTQVQKIDLAHEIQQALAAYADDSSPPANGPKG
ncbi:MAG: hypothetical protein AB1801_08885 [Chloroflexota bacterium]